MEYNTIAPEILEENCLKFFNGDKLATQVWMSKYALKNLKGEYVESSPQDRYLAIAKELKRIDKNYKEHGFTEEDYYSYLVNRIITPAGSGLTGIANPFSLTSLSNCFVVSLNNEDSYGSIVKVDEEFVQIAKRRGGVGLDLSSLRYSKALVTNAAGTSTGAVSFVSRYSNSLREVAQEGRRGAGMLSLSVNYPDVEKFIDLKLDKKAATGANLSVRVTDEFMQAVECDGIHVLRYPTTLARISDGANSSEFRKKVPAKDIWNKMMKAAHECAEPGVLFWDRIIQESPADCYPDYQAESTNPCQPGYAPLLTPNGLTTMDNVSIGDQIWSSEGWTTITNKVSTGIKPVYKYQTSKSIFYGTKQHRIVENGIKIEVDNAKNIDLLRGNIIQCTILDSQDIMDGLVFGDGSVHRASNNLVYLCIGKNDSDYFNSEIKDLIIKHRPGLTKHAYEVNTTIDYTEIPNTYLRKIPERYKTSTIRLVGFLRGLYSANGSVCGNRITLKAASKFVVEDVQLMLNSIGIRSYITTNKATDVKFNNGTYTCKQSYDLNITTDKDLFLIHIGFLQNYKSLKVKPTIYSERSIACAIQSCEYIADELVYDITVDNSTHTYWSGGCNVSNCGEVPLSPYDSCRLLSVNATKFVRNAFTEDAYFDFDSFKTATEVATIMMDNIIDMEIEKIDAIITKIENDKESDETKATELTLWKKIRKACINGRRAGISAIGYGDMLAMLNIRYASNEGNLFCRDLQKKVALQAYITSVELAEDRGAFAVFDAELERENIFLNRLFENDKSILDKMRLVGRRNIALLTIPPVGSMSILLENITSGIEPAFALIYKRKRKVIPTEENITFIDATGDCFQEYYVLHPKFKTWCELNEYIPDLMSYDELIEVSKLSPYYKATSSDLDPLKKIEMQGMVQKYVDHSISITHNLPESVTVEDVSKIYMAAWKAGCKGCTVYRDGSRDGILTVGTDKPKSVFEYRDSPKRPRDLPCDIFYPTINGERYIIMVGLYEHKPFEVFALKYSDNYLHHLVPKGVLRKQKSRHYNLLAEDNKDLLIDNLGSKFELPEWNAITRLISWGLRHGGDITFAVEQLNEAEGVVTDVSKVLARTLKKYAKPTRKSTGNCPECGGEMRGEGGCATCHNCGYSKCS